MCFLARLLGQSTFGGKAGTDDVNDRFDPSHVPESGIAKWSRPQRPASCTIAVRPGRFGLCICGFVLSTVMSTAANAEDISSGSLDSILENFEFGASAEVSYEHLRNFDLDRSEGDDLDTIPVELEFEALFEPSNYFSAYFRSQLIHRFVLREDGDQDVQSTELLINEAFVTASKPDLGVSLQLGRQLFEDERQWLYDAELDAVRGIYRDSSLLVELSASHNAILEDQDLLNDVDEESTNHYILYSTYTLNEAATVGAYGIVGEDRGNSDTRTVLLGVMSSGTVVEHLTYWSTAAIVRGKEDHENLRGYGIDILATYDIELPLSPRIIAGYAFGSGDSDSGDDRDGAFRQSGLQANEAEVGSLIAFQYYGEVVNPELSNMSIFTAGAGARPRDDLSIDLVYHYYLQDVSSDELRDSDLNADPTGRSRRLGSEIDLVVGFIGVEDLEVRGFLGYFLPGRAFEPGADNAFLARIEFEYEF